MSWLKKLLKGGSSIHISNVSDSSIKVDSNGGTVVIDGISHKLQNGELEIAVMSGGKVLASMPYQKEVLVQVEGHVEKLSATHVNITGCVGEVNGTHIKIAGDVAGDVKGTHIKCGNVQGNVTGTHINF